MKITDELVNKVHWIVNEKLSKEYPGLGMASHPEGSIKWWVVKMVLEAYKEIKK